MVQYHTVYIHIYRCPSTNMRRKVGTFAVQGLEDIEDHLYLLPFMPARLLSFIHSPRTAPYRSSISALEHLASEPCILGGQVYSRV